MTCTSQPGWRVLNVSIGVAELEAFPGHDGGEWAPVTCSVVTSWPAGHFAENLAVGAHGGVFVTLHSHNRIDRYDPATGASEPFCELPAPATERLRRALAATGAAGVREPDRTRAG